MKKILFNMLFGFSMIHVVLYSDVYKSINVKVGYSKIANTRCISENYSFFEGIKESDNGLCQCVNGHRVFGLGFGLKYNFPKYFFIGVNVNLENTDSKYEIYDVDSFVKFSSKNSVNLIPIVGVSIDRFNIYAGAGISYNQINYLQLSKIMVDPTHEFFDDYKVHNWRGNFVWCAGIDANINSNVSLGIEYKKTNLKFSFIELPNSLRFKSHFKTDHHTVSVTFKYKF